MTNQELADQLESWMQGARGTPFDELVLEAARRLKKKQWEPR